MYIFIIFIFLIINLILLNINKKIEGFRIKIKKIKINTKKIGDTFKKAGKSIKNTAKKVGSELKKAIPIPIPKSSYVPKTYPKDSYGIGVGQIPLIITMRPLKPGVKISRVNL
jgi:hypothetical protein